MTFPIEAFIWEIVKIVLRIALVVKIIEWIITKIKQLIDQKEDKP